MDQLIRRWVPDMFHRRLLWLLVVSVVTIGVLGVQITRLTTVQAASWRGKAEAALVQSRLVPTARGRVLDRRMRVLAYDRPTYDIAVRYPVITGDWAYAQARRAAYRANRPTWGQLTEEARRELTERHLPVFQAQVRGLWRSLCEVGEVEPGELEDRRQTVIRRVKRLAGHVWLQRLRRQAVEADEPVGLLEVARPIGEQQAAHALIEDVDRSAVVAIQQMVGRAETGPGMAVWGQVRVRASRQRCYPYEAMTVHVDRETLPGPLRAPVPIAVDLQGVGVHVVGGVRGVWERDLRRRPYRIGAGSAKGTGTIDLGGYLPGDRTGGWGVERSQENRLRGRRGRVVHALDRDTQHRLEPVSGQDVVLTLDIGLQGRIQAVMDPRVGLMKVQPWHRSHPVTDPLVPGLGQALHGAAVVMDVSRGEVLAAVSTPALTLEQLRLDPQQVWNDPIDRPAVNRVVAQAYQPGSTVKPLVLAAAVTEGVIGVGEDVACHGHLDPESPDRYRCWVYKSYGRTHGPLDGVEAIARSCNVFFYTMGQRLGAERLASWYGRLGLGSVTGCGLGGELAGDLPDLAYADRLGVAGFSKSDAIFMAIGQGPIRWTPLQAGNAYAALARGGYVLDPTFILVGDKPQEQRGTDLHMDPRGVELAMRGLKEAVEKEYGTTNHLALLDREPVFNLAGVEVLAKSGTAQANPLWLDTNGDGRFTASVDRMVRRGDHAWAICLVRRPGSPRPDYVVVVVVEFGGSGGAVAGPVANQVLHAMRAEGYL